MAESQQPLPTFSHFCWNKLTSAGTCPPEGKFRGIWQFFWLLIIRKERCSWNMQNKRFSTYQLNFEPNIFLNSKTTEKWPKRRRTRWSSGRNIETTIPYCLESRWKMIETEKERVESRKAEGEENSWEETEWNAKYEYAKGRGRALWENPCNLSCGDIQYHPHPGAVADLPTSSSVCSLFLLIWPLTPSRSSKHWSKSHNSGYTYIFFP